MAYELLPPEDWLEELKGFLVEGESNAHWDLLVCYHEVGRRIVEDGHEKQLDAIANYLGRSKRTIERMVQFYRKYSDINTLPEGKAISWHVVVNKYLPFSRKKEEKTSRVTQNRHDGDIVLSSNREKGAEIFYKNNLSYLDVGKILKRLINFDPEATHLHIFINRTNGKYEIDITSDKKIPTRLASQSKCPNTIDGHKGCIEFIDSFAESRKIKFPNYAKQIGALHKIFRAGFNYEEINSQIDKMEKDKFWSERGFDLTNIANELGKGGQISG